MILLFPATLLSILMGCVLGIIAAVKRGRAADFFCLSLSQFLWATPAFWLGLLFMMFSGGFLPLSGMVSGGIEFPSAWARLLDLLRHMAMPLLTLSLVMLGQYAIVMRNSLIDVLTEDYMVIARAKGLSHLRQLFTHALPNAVLPVMTLAALNLGLLIGGAIQTETVLPSANSTIASPSLRRWAISRATEPVSLRRERLTKIERCSLANNPKIGQLATSDLAMKDRGCRLPSTVMSSQEQ